MSKNGTGKPFISPQSSAKKLKTNMIPKTFNGKPNKQQKLNSSTDSPVTSKSQQNTPIKNIKQPKNDLLDSTHSTENSPDFSSDGKLLNGHQSIDDSEALLQMVQDKNNIQNQQIYSTASEFSDEEIIPRPKKNVNTKDKSKNNKGKKGNKNSKNSNNSRKPQTPNLTQNNNNKTPNKINNKASKSLGPKETPKINDEEEEEEEAPEAVKNENKPVIPKIIPEANEDEDEEEEAPKEIVKKQPSLNKHENIEEEEEDTPDVIAQKRLDINSKNNNKSSDDDDDSIDPDDNDSADSEDENTMPSPPLHESQNIEIKTPTPPVNKPLEIHNLQAPRPPPEFDDDDVYLEIQPQKKRPPPMWDSDENGNPIHRTKIAIQETAPRREFKGFDDLDLDDDSDDLNLNQQQQETSKNNNEQITTPNKQTFQLVKENERISSDMFASSESDSETKPQEKGEEEEKKEEEKPTEEEENKEEAPVETPKKKRRRSSSPSKLSPVYSLEEQKRRRKLDPNPDIKYFYPPTHATEIYQQMIIAKQKRMGIDAKPVKKPRKTATPSKIPISPKMRVRIPRKMKSPSPPKSPPTPPPPPPEPKTLKDFEEHDDDPDLYVRQVDKSKEESKAKKALAKKNTIQLPQFVKNVVSVKKAIVTLKEQVQKNIAQQEKEKEKQKEQEAEKRAMDNNVSIVNQTPEAKQFGSTSNFFIDDELAQLLAKKELLEREINNLEVQNTEFSTMTNEDIFLVTKYQSIVLSSVNEYMSGVLRSVVAHNERLLRNNQEMRTLNTELEKISKTNKHFNTIKFSTNKLKTLKKEILSQIRTIEEDMKNNNELAETIITSRSNIEAEAADLMTEALALQEEVEDLQQRIKEIEEANQEDQAFGSLSPETHEQLQKEKEMWDNRMKQLEERCESNLNNPNGSVIIKKKDTIDRSVFDEGPAVAKEQMSIQQSYYIIERSKDQSAKAMLEKLKRDYNENQLKLEDIDISIYQNLEEQEKQYSESCNMFTIANRGANNLQSKLVNSDTSYSDLNIRVSLLVNQIKDESFDYQKQIKQKIDDNFRMFVQRVEDDDVIRKVSLWADKKFPECRTKSTIAEKLKFMQTKLK